MKLLLILLLTAAPPWLSRVAASTSDDGTTTTRQTVVKTDGCGQAPGSGYAYAVASDEKGAPRVAMATADAAASDGRGKVARVRVVGKADSGEPGEPRAWLGVMINDVPEALAAQLETKGRGVIVVNVAQGSPADAAGFEAHDVIVSVGGEDVDGEIGRAVDLIKSRKAGEPLTFVVLRNGEEKTLTATLGARPDGDPGAMTWKFERAPNAEVEEHVKTHGKFIRRGDDGKWIVKDLGNLERLKDLPENIRMFLPQGGSRSTQVFVEGDSKMIKTRVERDGTSISMEQKDGDDITVRRTDADGKETVATYADDDALRSADEEAAKLWDELGQNINVHVDVDGLDDIDVDLDFDVEEWKDALLDWRSELEDTFGEAGEAYHGAMEEFHKAMEQWKSDEDGKGLSKLHRFHKLFEPGQDGGPPIPRALHMRHLGKPRHTFEVRADGTIEVRIRKGDSELVQLYTNEADLAKRNPELAKKYTALMSAGDEDE